MTKDEVLKEVRNLSLTEQSELIKELQESTFEKRFYRLAGALSVDEISESEIQEEVEFVRKRRFEQQKN